jgi:hypothetical protein
MNTTKEEVQSLLKKLPDFWNETQRIIGYHEQLVLGFTFIQPNPHNLGQTARALCCFVNLFLFVSQQKGKNI